jgi:ABC-type methionine transport system ATPase subunit
MCRQPSQLASGGERLTVGVARALSSPTIPLSFSLASMLDRETRLVAAPHFTVTPLVSY